MADEMLSATGIPPWQHFDPPNVEFCWDLRDRVSSPQSAEDRKAEAVETIRRLQSELVIYTDGSCVGGTAFGGSEAVVWSGDPIDGAVIDRLRSQGRRYTCSFDTEIAALRLAAEYIDALPIGPPVLICTDCASAVDALSRASADKRPVIRDVRRLLERAGRRISLLWVPSHCGIPGNEQADSEANAAANRNDRSTSEEEAVSLTTATAVLKARTRASTITHERLKVVYDRGRHFSPYSSASDRQLWSTFRIDWPSNFSRREHILLAQLRSGHCARLKSYSHRLSADADPSCPHCEETDEDVEHWLRSCPAHTSSRMEIFNDPAPPLSILAEQPRLALLYATLPTGLNNNNNNNNNNKNIYT